MSMILWLLAGVGLPVLLLVWVQYLRQEAVAFVEDRKSNSAAWLSQESLINWASRRGLMANLIWIIACTMLSITVYAIFGYHDYFSTDISYVVPPIVISLQMIVVGRLAIIFNPALINRYLCHLINTTLIGMAILLFIFLVFNRFAQIADTITFYLGESDPAKLQITLDIVNGISRTRPYLFLIAGAFILYKALSFAFYSGSKLTRFRELVLISCVALTGYSLFSMLNLFIFAWKPISGFSWIILSGMSAIILSIIASYGIKVEDAFISEVSRWLTYSKLRMFIIGSILCAYFVFLRPFTYSKAEWSTSVIEWGLTCFIIWRMYNGMQGIISDKYTTHLKYSSWKKHIKKIKGQIDKDLSYAIAIQREFVEYNQKDPLLIYLVTLLHDNGIPLDEVGDLVHPLTEYQQIKVPTFSSRQKRNKIREGNMERRKDILSEIMLALDKRQININR